jgi:cytochrome b subunit of formate dehydrogenase
VATIESFSINDRLKIILRVITYLILALSGVGNYD